MLLNQHRTMKLSVSNLIFETTQICNYNCRFCYNHWKNTEEIPNSDTSYKTLHRTLKQLYRQVKVGRISFSGGEPLLIERLPELMLYCKLKKSNVTLISNSALLSDETILPLCQVKLDGFQIPILSHNEEVHNWLTNSKGSWQKSIDNFKKLKSHNINTNVVVILTKKNIDDIDKTILFINDLGCKSFLINRFNAGGEGLKQITDIAITHKQLNTAFATINSLAKQHQLSINSGVCTPICVLNPNDFPYIRFSFCNNDITKRPITIDTFGNIRYCNHSPYNIGNIFKIPLPELLNQTELQEKYKSVPKYCINCSHFSRCRGGCRAAAEQIGKDFSYHDPYLDQTNM